MVTAEEIGAVKFFAPLDKEGRERLSRVARAGRVRGARGLRARALCRARGPDRTRQARRRYRACRRRAPSGGHIRRVPLALGTVFPVGFRAAEKARVMRVEAPDYHAVAAHEPQVAKEVGRLAAHRMSGSRGLQGIAADPLLGISYLRVESVEPTRARRSRRDGPLEFD